MGAPKPLFGLLIFQYIRIWGDILDSCRNIDAKYPHNNCLLPTSYNKATF
jgi:hypothetical protein